LNRISIYLFCQLSVLLCFLNVKAQESDVDSEFFLGSNLALRTYNGEFPLKSNSSIFTGPSITFSKMKANNFTSYEITDFFWNRVDEYAEFAWNYGFEVRLQFSKKLLKKERMNFLFGFENIQRFSWGSFEFRNNTGNRYVKDFNINLSALPEVYYSMGRFLASIALPITLYQYNYYSEKDVNGNTDFLTLRERGSDHDFNISFLHYFRVGIHYSIVNRDY
jgi:hypothetical protein